MRKWLTDKFIDKEFYAPFVIDKDNEYYINLASKYSHLIEKAKANHADEDTLKEIKKYTDKVLTAIRLYYHGNVISFHQIIHNLVKGCIDDTLEVDSIEKSYAFLGETGSEIQFFRGRISTSSIPFKAQDMLYLTKELRGFSDSYRFSIPGVPCLYLGNSSYACWLELGRPADHDFVVSPVLLDNKQRIMNLAVMNRDYHALNEMEETRVRTWLKLLILMIATSYRIKDNNRKFKSEYIVSQSIMLACSRLGLDGVAYYSKRVDDDAFSQAAINLALFVKYQTVKSKKSLIDAHIKIDDSTNYQMFRQLKWSEEYSYPLRCLKIGTSNRIGNYNHQYDYKETEFCRFDQFLFSEWKDKENKEFGI